jgi:hypothetical protein
MQEPQWGTPVAVKSGTPPPGSATWGMPTPVPSTVPDTTEDTGILGKIKSIIQGMGATERHITETAKAHPAATGAMIAGVATAPFTGGMSLPAAAGFSGLMAAGGAGAALAASQVANRDTAPAPSAMGNIAAMTEQGLGAAAGTVAGAAIAKTIGAAAPRVAQWLYTLGLRPSRAIRASFTGANAPGAVGVREGLLPNPEAIQARLSEIEGQVSAAISKADELPRTAGLLTEGAPPTRTVVIPLGGGSADTGPMTALEKEQLRDEFRTRTTERIARPLLEDPSGVNVATAREGAASIDPRRLQGEGRFGPVYTSEGSAGAPAGQLSGPGVLIREEALPRAAAAHAPGAPPTMVDPRQVAADATRYVMAQGNIPARGMRREAIDQLHALTTQYLSENGAPMTVQRALELKRAEQTLASASYQKVARGGDVNDVETLFHQGLANAARNAILAKAPEVGPLLAREQGLIGLKQAAEVAADRPEVIGRYMKAMSVITGVTTGHPQEGLMGAVILHALQSPNVTGALALATKALGGATAKLTPIVTRAIIAAYLGDPPSSAEMRAHRGGS